ncbi:hypothetical protein KPH14_012055 [Odynerus spinipes]|uniref:Uncharacterized protein n=1 Tax=Odynerus spinipes TaxID=1348599 RepID=A0AAD9VI69_9HYME|nr:hypothetical protein KPH14_012055 [Odynerus spinipes]
MFIFTFLSTFLILSRGKIRRGNDGYNASENDWDQFLSVSQETDQFSNYGVTYWIRQLQLEHCAFVEIGEDFCALFVEIHDSPFVTKIVDSSYATELFLGLCSCSILQFWNLCLIELTKCKKSDCTLTEDMVYDNTSDRVHRLCDIPLLNIEAPFYNCSMLIANQQLHRTKGFPTCLQSPLPKSLYTPCNVCGIFKCSVRTINGIYSIKCATNCHQRQLFCEGAGLWTSTIPAITSTWSQWSSPVYNNTCGEGLVMVVASCYNQVTREKAVDCIGTGLVCCPKNLKKCFCTVSTMNGGITAMRFTELCFSIAGCIQKDTHMHALKEELNDNSQGIDEVYYDNDNKEEILLVSPQALKSVRSLRRRLLQSIGHEYYGNMDYNAQGNKFNYRGYARYVGPAMSEDKDENVNEDGDDEDEDYEISDEKVDDNPEDEEEENENEEEEDDEVTDTESTIEYHDYETSGIDAPFGNIHKLQIGYFTRLTMMHFLFTFIIWT